MTKKATTKAKAINSIIANIKRPYDYKVTKDKLDEIAMITHQDLSPGYYLVKGHRKRLEAI